MSGPIVDRELIHNRVERVRRILFEAWDPVGVSYNANLIDEYDSYVPRVLKALDAGVSAAALAQVLMDIEWGLSPGTWDERWAVCLGVACLLLETGPVSLLDRPVWSSLTGRQAHLATARGGALRMHPDFGLFAAVADETPDSLAALGELVREHGNSGLVELSQPPPVPGTTVLSSALCWQMAAQAITPLKPADFEIVPLGDDDASEMLALATLTKPGPFFTRTHELGDFVGVKVGGELAAMAGERMRPDGFTEVSGVCSAPGHRGKGYAAGLMAHVAGAILARGETPFLHSYADNAGANALYQALGFRRRADIWFTVLAPQ